MLVRGYHPNAKLIRQALEKRLDKEKTNDIIIIGKDIYKRGIPIYKEHNNSYLIECLNNLENKGINI